MVIPHSRQQLSGTFKSTVKNCQTTCVAVPPTEMTKNGQPCSFRTPATASNTTKEAPMRMSRGRIQEPKSMAVDLAPILISSLIS